MILSFLLWSAPLLVIPLSYCSFRFVPFLKIRYCLYAIVLLTGFLFNLLQLSFSNDRLDTLFTLGINFILAEFLWNILRLKKKRLFAVALLIVLCVIGIGYRKWLTAGPEHGRELWKAEIAATYCQGNVVYTLKDRDLFDKAHPARLLVLSKKVGRWPVEKFIEKCRTPDGFKYTDFIYKWSKTSVGVRVDLWAPGFAPQIQTMGQGF